MADVKDIVVSLRIHDERFVDVSDRTLIDELKLRGYLVPKRGHVLALDASYSAPDQQAYSGNDWENHVTRQLAQRLARGLMQQGVARRTMVRGDRGCGYMPERVYRADIQVICIEPLGRFE